MQSVGELWRHGPEGIVIEHRAVELCTQALNQLRGLFPPPEDDAPVAIGGALEADPYTLPTLMVATVLAAAGWRAINLGPNLPIEALLAAVKSHGPRLVWVSCSVEAAARREEKSLRRVLGAQGIKTLVGGRAWKTKRWEAESGLTAAHSMVEVAAFAEGLRWAQAAR
jgi:methanogenic corrinoid protein MtbC1